MPWDNYKEYHIPYQNVKKNTITRIIATPNGERIVIVPDGEYATMPIGTPQFDGEIVIYAKDDKSLHDILQEILDTPVKVNDVEANLS